MRNSRHVPAFLFLLAAAASAGCSLAHVRRAPVRAEDALMADLESTRKLIPAPPPNRIAETGSLWTDAAERSLVSDTRASRVGDLLGVAIIESTAGSQSADTELKKDSNLNLAMPSMTGLEAYLVGKFPKVDPTNLVDVSGSKNFAGEGTTTRQSSIVATLGARVIGVYPNGDLAILGHKDVEVNHEHQVLTIGGVVRPIDIGPNNTVSSSRIAQLTLHLGGQGDLDNQQREGWFSRLLQKIWPF